MNLLKFLPVSMLWEAVAFGLMKLGTSLRNKDANDVGKDDAFGNFLLAVAPVVAAYEGSNETAVKKLLKGVRDVIDNYLKQPNTES